MGNNLEILSVFLADSRRFWRHSRSDLVFLIYVLYAWHKRYGKEKPTFDDFYNTEIEGSRLKDSLAVLAKKSNLFALYLEKASKLDSLHRGDLTPVFRFLHETKVLPRFSMVMHLLSDSLHGEGFYIPDELAQLAILLVGQGVKNVYSPFTRSFNFAQFFPEIKYFAEDEYDSRLTIELLKEIDGLDISFSQNNAIQGPAYVQKKASHLLEIFDAAISFPPFMTRERNTDYLENDTFNRFKFFNGRGSLDVAFIEQLLAQTSARAAILLPIGFTFRGGLEQEFRKNLVERNLVEIVFQLPANLLSYTNMESVLLVLNKQKSTNKTMFINLRNEAFSTKQNRRNFLTNIDRLIEISQKGQILEAISNVVSKEELSGNDFSFSVDRYILSPEWKKIQEALKKTPCKRFDEIADFKRSQLIPELEGGTEITEVSPSDLPECGFVLAKGRKRFIDTDSNRFKTYRLEPFDVLLSTKGRIGKVGIVGQDAFFIASQAFQIIRPKSHEDSIYLYLLLKSDFGQKVLAQVSASAAMPQIPASVLRGLELPWPEKQTRKEKISSFAEEERLHKAIEDLQFQIQNLHREFLKL